MRYLLAFVCIFIFGFQTQKSELRSVSHNAFRVGEKLTYVIHYGIINAGIATIELKSSDLKIQNRQILHSVCRGKSLGAFNALFKVDDLYESHFDSLGVFPWVFNRNVNEGGYKFTQNYLFLQNRSIVVDGDSSISIPNYTQDMISSFYFARTMNFKNINANDTLTIDCFVDGKYWPLRIKFIGYESVNIRIGKFKCLKFQPIVIEGRIFKTNEDLNVWISDDGNRIPILVQAKILVGSIKMELMNYNGLSNPIAKEN